MSTKQFYNIHLSGLVNIMKLVSRHCHDGYINIFKRCYPQLCIVLFEQDAQTMQVFRRSVWMAWALVIYFAGTLSAALVITRSPTDSIHSYIISYSVRVRHACSHIGKTRLHLRHLVRSSDKVRWYIRHFPCCFCGDAQCLHVRLKPVLTMWTGCVRGWQHGLWLVIGERHGCMGLWPRTLVGYRRLWPRRWVSLINALMYLKDHVGLTAVFLECPKRTQLFTNLVCLWQQVLVNLVSKMGTICNDALI